MFRDKIVRRYLKKSLKDIDSEEQRVLARINSFTVEEIIETVCRHFNLEQNEAITIRRGSNKNARKLAMFIAVKYCKKVKSLAEIASHFNIGFFGLSSNTKKCKEEVIVNNKLKKQIKTIEKLLNKKAKKQV